MSIASEISRLQQAKEDLATAIGNKGVTVSVSATLDDFADYVDDIVTGITPTGTKSITTNGTHDVTNYASASVAVPASAVDSGTKSITTNGTHDVVGYASANVNVPSSGIDTSDATATSAEILEEYTAYVNGVKVRGAIPIADQSFSEGYLGLTRIDQRVSLAGKYFSWIYVCIDPAAQTLLIPENIRDGVTILGVTGTYTGGGAAGETWRFNSVLSISSTATYAINFRSNGNTYSSLNLVKTIRPTTQEVHFDSTVVFTNMAGGWVDGGYMTIYITDGDDFDNADFRSWLEANATLQT